MTSATVEVATVAPVVDLVGSDALAVRERRVGVDIEGTLYLDLAKRHHVGWA